MATWISKEGCARVGVTVAVKDIIDVEGLPTTAGARAVAEGAQAAAGDAACLAGVRAAVAGRKASVLGKVNLHELAYGISGINPWFGTPVNPADPRLVPGGSSSGSACAVGAGEADVSIGTDTGGSVRIPAACCAVAGLKTTWGRISVEGVLALAPSLDTVGPLARDVSGLVEAMALLEPVFAPLATADAAGCRVGRIATGGDPATEAAVDAAVRGAGWAITPTDLGPAASAAAAAAMTVLDAEAWASWGPLAAGGSRFGDDVAERLASAATVTPAALRAARAEGQRWRERLGRAFETVELLAFPTLLGPVPLLDDAGRMAALRGINAAINLAGLPALALPIPAGHGVAGQGVAASLQLVAPAGGEELLLAAGALVEEAVGSDWKRDRCR